MAVRKPLVSVAGELQELPAGDTVSGASGVSGSVVVTMDETEKTIVITDSTITATSKVIASAVTQYDIDSPDSQGFVYDCVPSAPVAGSVSMSIFSIDFGGESDDDPSGEVINVIYTVM